MSSSSPRTVSRTPGGCARKLLVGEHEELEERKGVSAPLTIDGDQVGFVYRSRDGVKPIFISPGHRCGIQDAVDVTVACLRDYRMPEPMRYAHILANKLKRAGGKRKQKHDR